MSLLLKIEQIYKYQITIQLLQNGVPPAPHLQSLQSVLPVTNFHQQPHVVWPAHRNQAVQVPVGSDTESCSGVVFVDGEGGGGGIWWKIDDTG